MDFSTKKMLLKGVKTVVTFVIAAVISSLASPEVRASLEANPLALVAVLAGQSFLVMVLNWLKNYPAPPDDYYDNYHDDYLDTL